MNSNYLNVLVISGGSLQGLTVVKGLRYSDSIRIIMADNSRENIGRYFVDKFYVVDEVREKESFLKSLLDICDEENIKMIIPSTDIELTILAENLKLFNERDIHVAVSKPELLAVLRNKILLYKFLTEEKFPTLPAIDISAENLRFPILGKPRYGWGGKGIIVIDSKNEMHKYYIPDLKNNYVWQRLLENFDEYSIDCAIDPERRISELVVRIRVKTIGGFAAIAENVDDPKIEKMVHRLLKIILPLGAMGIFNIQIIKKIHDYYISDINPRIGTSAVFGYEQGINMPLFFCSAVNNGINTSGLLISNRTKKVKMVRYLEEFWIEQKKPDEVKAIVFDLDDTIINQKMWIVSKLEMLCQEFREIFAEKEIFLLKAVQIIEEGNRSRLFDALSQEFRFSESLKESLIKTYRTIRPQNCPIFSDVLPTLKGLKEYGFKLALLTDNPTESQKQKIETCNLEKLFNTIVYSRELNQEKPSAVAFKEVAKRLKVPEQYLVMVGDNLYKDVIGSLDSGYRTSYWLKREGTFFNFDEKLLNRLFKTKYNFIKIENLKYLLWSLVPEGDKRKKGHG